MLGSLKASFEQQRGADGPAFSEVLIVLIHRWLWCLSYLSISLSSRFLYPPQTHDLSVISVQPLSLSSSLSLKFEVRSGWKTFFTCCCCCLCPWATTPLAHNICVRLSREFLCPGHNLLSLPQSLFPSLSRASGGVWFEELMFFFFSVISFHVFVNQNSAYCSSQYSLKIKNTTLCLSNTVWVHHTWIFTTHYWMYDCVYACMRKRGQMVG